MIVLAGRWFVPAGRHVVAGQERVGVVPRPTACQDVLAVWQRPLGPTTQATEHHRRAAAGGYTGYQPGATVAEYGGRSGGGGGALTVSKPVLSAHAALAGRPEPEPIGETEWLVSYRRCTLAELVPPAVVEVTGPNLLICRPPRPPTSRYASSAASSSCSRGQQPEPPEPEPVVRVAIKVWQPPPWVGGGGGGGGGGTVDGEDRLTIEVEYQTVEGTALGGIHYRPPGGGRLGVTGRVRFVLSRSAPIATLPIEIPLLSSAEREQWRAQRAARRWEPELPDDPAADDGDDQTFYVKIVRVGLVDVLGRWLQDEDSRRRVVLGPPAKRMATVVLSDLLRPTCESPELLGASEPGLPAPLGFGERVRAGRSGQRAMAERAARAEQQARSDRAAAVDPAGAVAANLLRRWRPFPSVIGAGEIASDGGRQSVCTRCGRTAAKHKSGVLWSGCLSDHGPPAGYATVPKPDQLRLRLTEVRRHQMAALLLRSTPARDESPIPDKPPPTPMSAPSPASPKKQPGKWFGKVAAKGPGPVKWSEGAAGWLEPLHSTEPPLPTTQRTSATGTPLGVEQLASRLRADPALVAKAMESSTLLRRMAHDDQCRELAGLVRPEAGLRKLIRHLALDPDQLQEEDKPAANSAQGYYKGAVPSAKQLAAARRRLLRASSAGLLEEATASMLELASAPGAGDAMMEVVDGNGWGPLHHACAKGHADVLATLLSAVEPEIAHRLLRMRTDPDENHPTGSKDKKNKNKKNKSQANQVLLATAPGSAEGAAGEGGWTPLELAIKNERAAAAELAAEAGAELAANWAGRAAVLAESAGLVALQQKALDLRPQATVASKDPRREAAFKHSESSGGEDGQEDEAGGGGLQLVSDQERRQEAVYRGGRLAGRNTEAEDLVGSIGQSMSSAFLGGEISLVSDRFAAELERWQHQFWDKRLNETDPERLKAAQRWEKLNTGAYAAADETDEDFD